jgi:hypothetical protein
MIDRVQLAALCAARAGLRRGGRLTEFIAEWELCVRAHGRAVNAEEYAAWSWHSRATAYNRLREFRAAFPQLGPQGIPSDLMRPLLERLAAGQEDLPEFDASPVIVT